MEEPRLLCRGSRFFLSQLRPVAPLQPSALRQLYAAERATRLYSGCCERRCIEWRWPVLLRSCPRCSGDLFVERLPGAEDLVCLQCGYRKTVMRQAGEVSGELRRDLAPAA